MGQIAISSPAALTDATAVPATGLRHLGFSHECIADACHVGPEGGLGYRGESQRVSWCVSWCRFLRCTGGHSFAVGMSFTGSASFLPAITSPCVLSLSHRLTLKVSPPLSRNTSAQPSGAPAETAILESRKGGPGRLQRVVRRGGPLRSTTAELIRVKRHKFPDAHRRPAGHPLHAVRQPVIPTRPVQLGHRHQMPGQVLRQPLPFSAPVPNPRGGCQST